MDMDSNMDVSTVSAHNITELRCVVLYDQALIMSVVLILSNLFTFVGFLEFTFDSFKILVCSGLCHATQRYFVNRNSYIYAN